MRFFILSATCLLLGACTTMPQQRWQAYPPPQPHLQYHQAKAAVSSSSQWEQSYVSAFNEAQAEWQPSQTWSITPDSIWGKPPTSLGQGITLIPDELRHRLNDAIATTPVGQQASWKNMGLTFTFLPNSPLYRAHVSGGQCRDGVVVIHGESIPTSQRRGLFCQAGPASDWLLKEFR